MTIDPVTTGGSGLVQRVKNILLTPSAEWDRINNEPADTNKIYMGYVLPLVALSAICAFIGLSIFGISLFGVTSRVPMVAGVVGIVLQVAMGMASVFVLAFITNALAPSFGSTPDIGKAHQLAAYGSTAGFLAGVFSIFPLLAILGIVGLYSLALIYIGLPKMMKTPEDKRIGYFITIILVAIVVWIVMGTVVGAVRMSMGGLGGGYTFGQSQTQNQTVEGNVTLPGGGNVDLAEIQRQAEAYANGGEVQAVDPARLQQQLPQSLPGGFTLTSQSSGSAMGTAQAEGVYTNGGAELRVSVVHMGAMGAIAGMASGMNVQENRQDADGFARTQTIDGRIYTEEMSNSGRSASYGVIGRGVAVTAQGSNGVTLDQARAAVETIGVQRLEREFGA